MALGAGPALPREEQWAVINWVRGTHPSMPTIHQIIGVLLDTTPRPFGHTLSEHCRERITHAVNYSFIQKNVTIQDLPRVLQLITHIRLNVMANTNNPPLQLFIPSPRPFANSVLPKYQFLESLVQTCENQTAAAVQTLCQDPTFQAFQNTRGPIGETTPILFYACQTAQLGPTQELMSQLDRIGKLSDQINPPTTFIQNVCRDGTADLRSRHEPVKDPLTAAYRRMDSNFVDALYRYGAQLDHDCNVIGNYASGIYFISNSRAQKVAQAAIDTGNTQMLEHLIQTVGNGINRQGVITHQWPGATRADRITAFFQAAGVDNLITHSASQGHLRNVLTLLSNPQVSPGIHAHECINTVLRIAGSTCSIPLLAAVREHNPNVDISAAINQILDRMRFPQAAQITAGIRVRPLPHAPAAVVVGNANTHNILPFPVNAPNKNSLVGNRTCFLHYLASCCNIDAKRILLERFIRTIYWTRSEEEDLILGYLNVKQLLNFAIFNAAWRNFNPNAGIALNQPQNTLETFQDWSQAIDTLMQLCDKDPTGILDETLLRHIITTSHVENLDTMDATGFRNALSLLLLLQRLDIQQTHNIAPLVQDCIDAFSRSQLIDLFSANARDPEFTQLNHKSITSMRTLTNSLNNWPFSNIPADRQMLLTNI